MTATVRGGPVPFLLRGFLRLLALGTPLFVLFTGLDSDDRQVSWVDHRSLVDSEVPSGMYGAPEPGTQLQLDGKPHFTVDHASLGLWLVTLLPTFLLLVAVSAVALMLLRTLRETYAGQPFSARAVRRLRLVAAVIAAAAVVVPLLQSVSIHAITHRVVPEQATGLWSRWDVLGETVPWLVGALLVLCVSEAFGVGTRLTHDVDGLV